MTELSEAARKARNEYHKQRNSTLSEAARLARNAYLKAWKHKNAEKVQEYNVTYWQRKADKAGVTDNNTDKVTVTHKGVTDKLSVSKSSNTLKCFECGKSFEGKRSDSKFCSPSCKQKFHRKKAK